MITTLAIAALGLTFNNSMFHVIFSSKDLLNVRDLHVFNGEAPDSGGDIAAKCTNGTVDPYTVTFGAFNTTTHQRHVSATIKQRSKSEPLDGHAYCYPPSEVPPGRPACYTLVWGKVGPGGMQPDAELSFGPNPPPAPPRPPQCQTSYNQAACDAVGAHACKWCTSSDGLHKLCFDGTNLPTTGWQCEKSARAGASVTLSTTATTVFGPAPSPVAQCESTDVCDTPVSGVKLPNGQLALYCGNGGYPTHRMVGATLDTLKRECGPSILASQQNCDPSAYAFDNWVSGVSNVGGSLVATIDMEYHG